MELVTVAHVTLYRVGSASRFGLVSRNEVQRVAEVPDQRAQSLRELVLAIAEEHGESRESLKAMWQENAAGYTQQQGAVVFNIHGQNVQYGMPYALCYAHPAMKIGGRYFKLEEVEVRVG